MISNLSPVILSTIPDSETSLISIKTSEIQNFSIIVTDDNTDTASLTYIWEISINNDTYLPLSSASNINFNANTYGIGDFISLKLSITDDSDNKVTVNWRIIIIE